MFEFTKIYLSEISLRSPPFFPNNDIVKIPFSLALMHALIRFVEEFSFKFPPLVVKKIAKK